MNYSDQLFVGELIFDDRAQARTHMHLMKLNYLLIIYEFILRFSSVETHFHVSCVFTLFTVAAVSSPILFACDKLFLFIASINFAGNEFIYLFVVIIVHFSFFTAAIFL